MLNPPGVALAGAGKLQPASASNASTVTDIKGNLILPPSSGYTSIVQ
jgi:hypothetical protein